MQTCIMYPSNSTSLILGTSLFREDHNVYLYCPRDIHARMAHTIPLDLDIASFGLASEVHSIDTLDLLVEMDFVVFPTLDVLPNRKRSEFASTLKDLFWLVQ